MPSADRGTVTGVARCHHTAMIATTQRRRHGQRRSDGNQDVSSPASCTTASINRSGRQCQAHKSPPSTGLVDLNDTSSRRRRRGRALLDKALKLRHLIHWLTAAVSPYWGPISRATDDPATISQSSKSPGTVCVVSWGRAMRPVLAGMAAPDIRRAIAVAFALLGVVLVQPLTSPLCAKRRPESPGAGQTAPAVTEAAKDSQKRAAEEFSEAARTHQRAGRQSRMRLARPARRDPDVA